MTLTKKLFIMLGIVGLVALAAVGLHGLLMTGAWAQPAPGGPPAGGEGAHAEGGHQEGAPNPMGGPPMPDPNAALKSARSRDLTTKQEGLQQLGTLYAASTDAAVLKEVEVLLRDSALHGETSGLRQAAVTALGQKAANNGSVLLQATNDPDPEVLTAALGALLTAPASREIDARLQQLAASPDPAIAAAAAGTLMRRYGRLGAEGVPLLVQALGIDRADANSNAALQLIGMGRSAVPPLMEALASSPNPLERYGAALVLGIVCAGKTPRQEAFSKAAQAEWKTKQENQNPDLRPLAVLADRLLHDSDELTREMCAQGLGYLGNEQAAPALAQALLTDPSAHVRAWAASALVVIPGKTALPALQTAVEKDKSPRVRRFAAEALGWTDDPQVTGALIAATSDPDEQVRRLAALQLGRLKAESAVSSLTAMFNDPSEDVRWAAVRAVDGLRSRAAVPALVMAAQDSSVLVAHAAQSALQKMGEVRTSESNLKQAGPGGQ
jgi:HEAT repeat protein